MKTLIITVVLALSFIAAQAEPFQSVMSIFMKSSDDETKTMDVPFVSFDNMAFETLKSDALSTTTLADNTTLASTTAATTKKASKDKRKKRTGRKYRHGV
ncbi:hypothetical protein KR044_013103 [Drosophila immigrans]|nr:hypothetical protein KR044_013103 [Drosophila immigrans]